MSWRGTILLLALAGLAIAFLLFSGRSETHPPQEPLLKIDPARAQKIAIYEGGSVITFIKINGIWMIQNDQKSGKFTDRANPKLINSLLEEAANIIPLDILRSHDLQGDLNLGSLGLKKPQRVLVIEDSKLHTLWIGVQGAAPGSLYARLDPGKTIYLIPSKIASIAFQPMQEFRDPRLTSLDPEHLSELTITKGNAMQQLHLTKDSRNAHGWLLQSPVSAIGSQAEITELLNTLLGAPIIRWMPEGSDASICAFDTPTATISLLEEGSTNPLTITIGAAAGETGSYFVQCSDRPGICVVAGGATKALAATPETLRSKKLAPVDYDTIDRIEIGSRSFKRKVGSDDWITHKEGQSEEVLIAAEKMIQCYNQLQELTATSFEPATPEHLSQRGLQDSSLTATNARTRVRLIAQLSENTAQENAGETVLADYSFGPSINDEIALRVGSTAELLILPANSLEFLKHIME